MLPTFAKLSSIIIHQYESILVCTETRCNCYDIDLNAFEISDTKNPIFFRIQDIEEGVFHVHVVGRRKFIVLRQMSILPF